MKKQKDSFTIETISDDLRERSAAADDSFSEVRKASVTFRKVFKGFDEVEVLQYIEDQEEAFKSASSIYERTLEDSKSENTLLRRENKALKQNIAELEEKIKELEEGKSKENEAAAAESDFVAEPLTAVHGVEIAPPIASAPGGEAVARLEAEIAEYAERILELQAQVAELERRNEELEDELAQARTTLAAIEAENSALRQPGADGGEQLKQAQATIDGLNEKLASLEAQLAEKAEEYEKAVAGFERFKRDAGDSAIMADTYTKQAEKLTGEIAQLRAVNQKQAYEYAEKLSEIEAATGADRAKVSQQMKMHAYHLRQIDALLAQLTEQFGLAREAVEDL